MNLKDRLPVLVVTAVLVAGAAILVWKFTSSTLGETAISVKVPKLTAVAAQGQQVFVATCAQCHGVNAAGTEIELWKGTDPTPVTAVMGRSVIPIPQGTSTRRIKVYLDSSAVPGWNEIDAIALHDRDGTIQWASNAWASSSFGENRGMPRWFWP